MARPHHPSRLPRRSTYVLLMALSVFGCRCASETATPPTGEPPGATDTDNAGDEDGDTETADDTEEPGLDTAEAGEDGDESDRDTDDEADGSSEPPVDQSEPGACRAYGSPIERGQLPEPVDEASGLVMSARDPGVLWMHNDSGDTARLFAVDADDGELLTTVHLAGVEARDWEDMASGPCGEDTGGTCLYVGDIGDNAAVYESVFVHRIREPPLTQPEITISAVETMEYRYPDGPCDAEGLVVDDDANVWILSKPGDGSFTLFRMPFARTDDTPARPVAIGTFDITWLFAGELERVTAADYVPSRGRLLVRTYSSLAEYRLPEGAGLSRLRDAERLEVPHGVDIQGETIAYGRGGYWHVSEGERMPIWFVPCAR